MTWGLLGFAAGAYIMLRADNRTRRLWMRQARRMGRQVERATERALRSSGARWVNDAIGALGSK